MQWMRYCYLFVSIFMMNSLAYAEVEQVSLQLKWKHQFQFSGYYMALEKGFFKDVGLDVKIIEGGTDRNSSAYVLMHPGGYAIAGSGALIEHGKGRRVKALGAVYQHSPLTLMVLKDSNIQMMKDLSGKRIMFSSTYQHAGIEAALQRANVNEFVHFPMSYDIQDLILGKIDAYSAYATHEPGMFNRLGIGYRLLDLRKQGVDLYGDVIITSEQETIDHAERVEHFMNAVKRGWKYALEHTDETIDLILLKYNSQNLLREDLLFEAKESPLFILPNIVPIGYMNIKRWQDIAENYASLNMLPSGYNVDDFIYQKGVGFLDWFKSNSESLSLWLLLLLSLVIVGVWWLQKRYAKSVIRLSMLQASELERERAQWKLSVKNRSLERALSKAEEAMQAKGQFLAMMSHEIRTPLNGVLGLTELVLSTDLNDQQRKNLQTAYASGGALLTILNDILDFSKMEAGLMEVDSVAFDVNQLLERVSMLFSSGLYGSKVDVQMVVRGVPVLQGLYMGDADRLHQVMMNLISNAVKFTEQGEIIISADVLSETDAEVVLRFQVSDTGMGISSADQQNLFEEFTQADGTDMRKHGGTGLGLAIVKRLVALMGGEIQLESKQGLGSHFFFDLSLDKTAKAGEGSVDAIKMLAGLRVLIVEAHEPSALMLQGLLAAWGLKCDVCDDTEAVIAMLTCKQYQLVLVDGSMSNKQGDLLVELISTQQSVGELKVIAMMALSVDMDDFQSSCAVDGFVRKPVYQGSLLETLQVVMGKKQRSFIEQATEIQVLPRQEKILLAEDNEVNQLVVCGMLNNQGFTHIDLAENGFEAIDMFEKGQYELVLMDIQMPEMGGLEASREIRKLEKSQLTPAHVPIVALTAHALQEDRQKSLDAGMDGHLVKPITGQDIAAMLARYLPLESVEPAEACAVVASLEDGVVLDQALLRGLRKDIGFGLGAILDAYLAELPKQLEAIVKAIESNDAAGLRQYAHRLKGGSRSIAAISLGERCYQLELLGQQGDLMQAKAHVVPLQQSVAAVEQAFSEAWLLEVR